MLEIKVQRLKEILKGYQKVICTFSGGVDSTLLLYLSLKTLGRENVLSVTFVSPIYPCRELKEAKKILNILKPKHIFLFTEELEEERFKRNPRERCYFCKKSAYRHLQALIKKTNLFDGVVIEGTNLSDLKDYRPGRKALKELGIKSPLYLAGIEKDEIRSLAKKFSLPNYHKPPSPCLASRIPFWQRITEKDLDRIERGEEALRELGLSFFRLRSESETARIEVAKDWTKVLRKRKAIVKKIKELGYRYITLDLEGYRPMGTQ